MLKISNLKAKKNWRKKYSLSDLLSYKTVDNIYVGVIIIQLYISTGYCKINESKTELMISN